MTLEYKGNVADPEASDAVKGLWEVYEKGGKSSYTEHKLKTVWTSCKKTDHYFEITDSPRREATCNICGYITTFIVGIDDLIDGKFVLKTPKK